MTVFPFSYSQGKYLLWEGLWTNGRGDRNQHSHSHFFFFFFFFCLFLRLSPQRTCFCTMKKSFLYAAMPLLNWRLSAAVQLSDPKAGGGGGREGEGEGEGERERDLKGGTCSTLMESLKTLKYLLLVYILNVQGSRRVLSHPPPLKHTHTHTHRNHSINNDSPVFCLGLTTRCKPPPPSPLPPSSRWPWQSSTVTHYPHRHHPDTLTAAAATALRRRLRGWGFILAELLADFSTNYERVSASCVESIRWRAVRRQIRF